MNVSSEQFIEQLKVYRDAPSDFLLDTDIGLVINYAHDQIFLQIVCFAILYLMQAFCVGTYIIHNSWAAHQCQLLIGILLILVDLFQLMSLDTLSDYFRDTNAFELLANILVVVEYFFPGHPRLKMVMSI